MSRHAEREGRYGDDHSQHNPEEPGVGEEADLEVHAHHACEERVLRDFIPTIDAWGQVRGERMVETHVEDHRNFLVSLEAAAVCADKEDGAAAIKILLDSLLDHMRDEEKYLLAADVLTDDLRFGEGFAG